MVDFHSHILPNIDDGSQSVEMSLEMLKASYEAGVTDVVATSHCYPRENASLLNFLKRRELSYNDLLEAMEKDGGNFPKIHLGCELNMSMDIARLPNIGSMRIADTDYIMVEMPFDPWREWMSEAVYNLTVLGLKPIMAHIDRFLGQKKEALMSVFELDVIYQVNTSLFLDKHMSKVARDLLSDGKAQLLGTDMHNMQTRKPDMKEAKVILEDKYSPECIDFFKENAFNVLQNKAVSKMDFQLPQKKSFLRSLFEKK